MWTSRSEAWSKVSPPWVGEDNDRWQLWQLLHDNPWAYAAYWQVILWILPVSLNCFEWAESNLENCLVNLPLELCISPLRVAVWRAEQYFAIRVCFNLEIGLPSIPQMWLCWLAELALDFCQHLLKLTRQFVCLKCTAIAVGVNFDQEGPFEQAGSHVLKPRLRYDARAHTLELLDYSFVDIHGA